MARPRRPVSPAQQAANAQRQAANAAARNAGVYWRQQAQKKKRPTVPGGQGTYTSDPSDPASYANPTATAGGISVGGVPPTVPTQFDQWLTSYQPYRDAIDAAQADRATQIARGSRGIADALGMWGGDLTAFKDALTKQLGGDGMANQLFLQSLMGLNGSGWDAIQNASTNATSGGVSVLAQLQRAQQNRQFALENDANARGIFRSGETMDSTQRNEAQRAQEQYGEQQKLMQYLTGLTSALAESEAQRAAAIRQAATGAEDYYLDPNNQIQGVAGMSGAVGAGDPTAPPPPAPSSPAVSPTSPSQAARREAYRRRRAAAQAAAARARAAAQGRAV